MGNEGERQCWFKRAGLFGQAWLHSRGAGGKRGWPWEFRSSGVGVWGGLEPVGFLGVQCRPTVAPKILNVLQELMMLRMEDTVDRMQTANMKASMEYSRPLKKPRGL